MIWGNWSGAAESYNTPHTDRGVRTALDARDLGVKASLANGRGEQTYPKVEQRMPRPTSKFQQRNPIS